MGLTRGLRHFVAAFGLTFGPRLRTFIALPALLSLLVITGGLYVAFGYVDALSAYLRSFGWWPDWLSSLIDPLLYVATVLIGAWVFSFLAAVLASPFYGELSNRVDPAGAATRRWYQIAWETLAREAVKLRYLAPRLLGLLALGFVPVLNLAAPALWLLYGGWLMAVQFCDYSFENRAQPFADTLQMLRRNRAACIALGAGMSLGMSIPLLNFAIAPVAVVAATTFVRELRERDAARSR